LDELEKLLRLGVEKKASDLYLSASVSPQIRLDGDIHYLNYPFLDSESAFKLITSAMTDAQLKEFEKNLEIDFSFEIEALGRFRVNAFHHRHGTGATYRIIPKRVSTIEELQFPSIFMDIANYSQGIVLVTGPTGSGKSTSLAAIVDYINRHQQKHIITIEDPIEFYHQSNRSLVHQREVHRDTDNFQIALRSALRANPDVILVGEMRDLETIRLALTAAETGHLVLATLHTGSAAKTTDRIIDVFPGVEKDMVRAMLSESLRAVVSQILIKRIGGGLVAVQEIMIALPAIRNLMRENRVSQMPSIMQTGKLHGMQTFSQALQTLVADGVIAPDVAEKTSASQRLFFQDLK